MARVLPRCSTQGGAEWTMALKPSVSTHVVDFKIRFVKTRNSKLPTEWLVRTRFTGSDAPFAG